MPNPPHEIDAIKKCFSLYVKFPKTGGKKSLEQKKMMPKETEFIKN